MSSHVRFHQTLPIKRVKMRLKIWATVWPMPTIQKAPKAQRVNTKINATPINKNRRLLGLLLIHAPNAIAHSHSQIVWPPLRRNWSSRRRPSLRAADSIFCMRIPLRRRWRGRTNEPDRTKNVEFFGNCKQLWSWYFLLWYTLSSLVWYGSSKFTRHGSTSSYWNLKMNQVSYAQSVQGFWG